MQNGSGYQGFGDMFDGGGAGASGQSFEGGGLLSMIANMIATPRGSQQRQQESMGGLLSPQARPAMPMQAQPQPMPPQYPNTPPPGTERFSDMLASGQLDDMYGSWMDNNETITPPVGLR